MSDLTGLPASLGSSIRSAVRALAASHGLTHIRLHLQSFGDKLLLCGEIDPNLPRTPVEDMAREKSAEVRNRLLLSGDVEPNPGPRR